MPKPQEEPVLLPPGPVDFDKLCAALRDGKEADKAIEAATKNNPKPEEVDMEKVAAEQAEHLADLRGLTETTPGTSGKTAVSTAGKE